MSSCSTTSKLLSSNRLKTLFQIALDDVHASANAFQHLAVVQFDAVAGALALVTQAGQQLAIATAQIEHARRGGTMWATTLCRWRSPCCGPQFLMDAVEVGTHQGVVARVVEQEGIVSMGASISA